MDERSRAFPVRATVPKAKRSYTWALGQAPLDQGQEGACVGFAFTQELASRPVVHVGVDARFAREQVYYPTQQNDPWEGGEYPGALPRYGGTTVIDGAKTMVRMGAAGGYRWSFGMDDLILGVGYAGPAVMGLDWFEGMWEPDEDGFVWPTGDWVGGHAILNNRVMVAERAEFKHRRFFELPNTWGPGWGPIGGRCRLTFDAMEYLLIERRGEACFLTDRKKLAI